MEDKLVVLDLVRQVRDTLDLAVGVAVEDILAEDIHCSPEVGLAVAGCRDSEVVHLATADLAPSDLVAYPFEGAVVDKPARDELAHLLVFDAC